MEKSTDSKESVQVIVRCRPMSEKEIASDCSNVMTIYPERGVVEVQNPKAKSENEKYKIFTYDAVYDWNSTQQNLYDEIIRPLVSSVLEGYNGCVFAYGQTGTGKTYTMEGIDGNDEEKGIIPRAFEQIWSHINRTEGVEFFVCVRYLEIYMEEIRDLLRTKSGKPLELHESTDKGVYVSHLHSHSCQSAADMLKAMRIGNHNRTTAATNMNEHSSRSHAIFQIVIEMAEGDKKSVKVGKLNLIDLAGSERQSKTGAVGERLKEASKINKALSSLGNVIYALAENSSHIPYRDSKLTRLLQDSLGGNSKTIMIANIGPASSNYEESTITLRYAYRAKSIKNKPVKNEDVKDGKLLELQDEIERLRNLIAEKSGGNFTGNAETDDSDVDSFDNYDESDTENEKEKQLELSKMEMHELNKKLRTLEKQMIHGGKNIVESVNENELKLEQQRTDIAARKKREVEMQQKIELEEESCLELNQVFANLQQEVEFKRGKLKRLYTKLQSLRQEIKDNREDYLQERQELAESNEETRRILQQRFLIVDNFVPAEEKSRIISLSHFDENLDDWVLKPEKINVIPKDRPIAHDYRRPVTDYSLQKDEVRYRGENIIDLKFDMPLRTTQNYQPPLICPQIKAAVKNIIKGDLESKRIVIKSLTSGVSREFMKLELEGKFNRASKNLVEVKNNKHKF